MDWTAIVLAGGSGSRMGAGKNKVLLQLCGKSVISRSVEALSRHADSVIVVCRAGDEAALTAALTADGVDVSALRFAPGGETRQASVANGLKLVETPCVMVHDGARCLVDDATIDRVKASVAACGTGVAAVPVTDTIKAVDAEENAVATPDRAALRAVQTPQGFTTELLRRAHAQAAAENYLGTDDASLIEHLGLPVHLTEGSRGNIKLTTPEDLTMAESLLSPLPALRIGEGYDVHAFAEGRDLILCGVKIPHDRGLLGHSDADVAVHALMDALLGALALGDIGQHFPDTDPAYKGADSVALLRHVVGLLKEHRAQIVNADVTIVAQRPKLMPHIPQMRANLAAAMGVTPDRISVKATTTERLGFEGRQEGISAKAVCLLALT